MKKSYFILFAWVTMGMLQNIRAQVWLGVYGMRTNSTGNLVSSDIGGGFAMSVLSPQKSLVGKSPAAILNASSAKEEPQDVVPGFAFQFGGNFYYSGLGQRNFQNVPLNSMPAGLAKVTLSNALWGMNAIGRLFYSNKTPFMPYIDALAGYRGTYSSLDITPYMHTPGYSQETTQSVSSVSGLNYGIGAGIMTRITRRIRFDAGVSYAEAIQYGGHVADLGSAYSDVNGVTLHLKDAPNGLLMVNFGLLFYVYDDKSQKSNCHCNHGSATMGTGVRTGGWGWGGGARSGVNVNFGGAGGGFRAK